MAQSKEAPSNGMRIGVKDSLSTIADQKALFRKTSTFSNKAQIKELQSASAAFLRAKEGLLGTEPAKIKTPEQK